MAQQLLRGAVSKGGIVLDPRTKIFTAFVLGLVLLTGGYDGAMAVARPALTALPLALLLASRKWGASVGYVLAYAASRLATTYLLPATAGLANFVVMTVFGIFLQFLPCIMMFYFVFSTTTVSEFIAAMGRMHVTDKIAIPLSVMFRFFPTVSEEYAAINDAMRMRGVTFGRGSLAAMLEYRLVPMMVCSVRIGEELSAAALTRGLGSPVKRTNVCRIGFHAADAVVLAVCAASLVAFAGWYVDVHF